LARPAEWRRFEVDPLEASRPDDLEPAIAHARELRSDALVVSTIEGFYFANRTRIIEAAAKHRLPAVFAAPPFGLASAGALLAYGAILKGAQPAELPVEKPVKFELGVNLKTAKVLGVTVPQSILVQADEVIE
jgi:putative tryptophan/tyrosine transport system substrate-binding protein